MLRRSYDLANDRGLYHLWARKRAIAAAAARIRVAKRRAAERAKSRYATTSWVSLIT